MKNPPYLHIQYKYDDTYVLIKGKEPNASLIEINGIILILWEDKIIVPSDLLHKIYMRRPRPTPSVLRDDDPNSEELMLNISGYYNTIGGWYNYIITVLDKDDEIVKLIADKLECCI